MPLREYMWTASTFKPVELGPVENEILGIFANNSQYSTYGVYKAFKAIAYKNIHKRVKRLSQLRLIEPVGGHFERGAKYYKVSPHGLITYLGTVETEISDYLHNNKDNIVIRSLLLDFLMMKPLIRFAP